MRSCIFEGQVRHRRFRPRAHAFRYRVFMLYLDLEELPRLFKRRWLWSVSGFNLAWFRRADHLGDARADLDSSVRSLVAQHTGHRPTGPIRLLTQLRYLGFGFNPVSFFYCFDPTGERVEYIVAEVNNTPWREQFCYVLDCAKIQTGGRSLRHQVEKAFHVSPFMPMEIDYDWRFSSPGKTLAVHMENRHEGALVFDATMAMRRREMTGSALARLLVVYPLIPLKVVFGIYYEAFRLLLKRIPIYDHPNKHRAANNEMSTL